MAVDYLSSINQGGSGLNITQIVDSLVAAENDPQAAQIQSKIDSRTTSISAIGEIKSALSVLSTSLGALTGNTSLSVKSTSGSLSASVTDPSTAVAINSTITVTNLAKGQTLAFEDYSSNVSLVGAGTLSLERGDWSSGSFVASPTVAAKSLAVATTDTLESLKDKINALNYGVVASVLGAGDGTYTLVMKSGDGRKNALRITATENPSGSGLSIIDNASTNSSKQKVAGTDAAITVDGISLTRSSNTVSDIFTGYQVNLLASTVVSGTDTPAVLTGSVDTTLATTNLQSFVTAVNKTKTLLNDKTFRGTSSKESGELSDDPVIKNVQSQIKSLTSTALSGFGANGVFLSNLGVRTEKDGLLSLNTTVLKDELKRNPSSLDAIFNSMYSASSSLLSVSGGSSSSPKSGTYAFSMTAYISGNVAGLKSNDTSPNVSSSNNTLQLTVDGTTSGTITVPAAHYSSEAALATAIQTAVNTDSTLAAAGKSVVVTHANGNYSVSSSSTGSSTSMVVNSIGSNLNGFLKFTGSANDDGIGESQTGTAATALTINGASAVDIDPDGLVANGSRSGSGSLSISGSLSSQASSGLNGFVSVASGSDNASVTFTITGTNVDGTTINETVTGVNNNSVSTTNIFATVTRIQTNGTVSGVNIGNIPAIVATSGTRATITSAGGNETSNSFTIVGTDLSGVAQTEVITGPAVNGTTSGLKTFKTITSIKPTNNTAAAVKVGVTTVGITTVGITGSATLDGVSMSADPASSTFTITSGNAAGMKVKYAGVGENGNVFFGQSLIEKLSDYLTGILNKNSGQLSTRETTINKEVTDQSALLIDLNDQMESLRSRYIAQFTAMEQSVTSLKSTGEYLTNLFDAMNKDN